MLPTIEWKDDAVVMIDQRKLPASEVYVTCKTAQRGRQGDQDDGDSRRAGDRRGGRDGHRARHAAEQGHRHQAVRDRVSEDVRPDGGDASDRGQSVLGHRADEASRLPTAAQGGGSVDEIKQRLEARGAARFTTRTSRAAGRWARTAPTLVPDDGADPDALQRRRAGDRRLRHGARRDSRGGRAGQEGRGARRRDAAVPSGRAADRVGAGQGRHRHHRHHRQHGRRDDAARATSTWSWSAPIASPPTATSPTRSAPTASPCWRKEHGIPFYVAAPLSTIDLDTPDGSGIPIEERNEREVTHVGATRLTPEGARIRNPAFDVTPAKYVTAIITERGIARAPLPNRWRSSFEARCIA